MICGSISDWLWLPFYEFKIYTQQGQVSFGLGPQCLDFDFMVRTVDNRNKQCEDCIFLLVLAMLVTFK